MENNAPVEEKGSLQKLGEALEKGEEFLKKFKKSPDDPHNHELKSGLTIDEVFKEAKFDVVKFSDLDPVLQEGIKGTGSEKWYGYPLDINDIQLPNRKIFINAEQDTIYCVFKSGDVYQWSRIKKTSDSYRITSIDNDKTIGGVIDQIIVSEIYAKHDPENYSEDTDTDDVIVIPIESERVVEEIRDRIIGLA
jgi:hypothetical protein